MPVSIELFFIFMQTNTHRPQTDTHTRVVAAETVAAWLVCRLLMCIRICTLVAADINFVCWV